jgi:hypothetical protein
MKFFNKIEEIKLDENLVKEYKEEGFKPLLKFMREYEMTYPQK